MNVTCLTGHRLAVLSNGALKFSRVTLGDAGTYQCLAKNEAGVAVGRTKLVLQGNMDCCFLGVVVVRVKALAAADLIH